MKKQLLLRWMTMGHVSVSKVLLQHYAKLGLNEEELVLLIHVHSYIEEGFSFPTPEDLSKRMTLSSLQCSQLLRQLLMRGFITIEENNDNGVFSEYYSLEPLWEQLFYLLSEEQGQQEDAEKEETELNVYSIYEQEFSRPLSPMECETLSMWIDHDQHSPELIIAALREAVVSGKLNFRYIDRILFEWQKNHVRTVQEAKAYGEKFRKVQQKQKNDTERPTSEKFPTFNWLEK
ncbi:DnaD domain-containing protein [Alkalihalobacillus sp. LMS39]|uniref:DnaD domain-containing protein n=1 Tax=Alkalihalobacillus sp. LMS39 TaxID=2924032 RepID=UPI001FB22853|nr:DnaD domain-containing protein [Alkalihalobacillus sp. LMS39]UOE92302.1 DnaD domain-containing protein [Alkalihalobacillus sp. LMS39]